MAAVKPSILISKGVSLSPSTNSEESRKPFSELNKQLGRASLSISSSQANLDSTPYMLPPSSLDPALLSRGLETGMIPESSTSVWRYTCVLPSVLQTLSQAVRCQEALGNVLTISKGETAQSSLTIKVDDALSCKEGLED
ncbi:uncharacterized protein RHO17_025172 isoform 1-T2 [Thomomys bottae]